MTLLARDSCGGLRARRDKLPLQIYRGGFASRCAHAQGAQTRCAEYSSIKARMIVSDTARADRRAAASTHLGAAGTESRNGNMTLIPNVGNA